MLHEILSQHADQQPDKTAFRFYDKNLSVTDEKTYRQLERDAKKIAAHLLGFEKGSRILLLFPSGLDYVTAFFACHYANMIAVPVYPPTNRHTISRIKTILSDACPAAILTLSSVREKSDAVLEHPLPIILVDDLSDIANPIFEQSKPEDLAMLQYTSGSTASPKGVMLTHKNLICNQAMIQKAFEHSRDTIVAAWLPLFHDMGLIGNILQPIYLGAECHLMSPMDFMQRPRLWLQLIDKVRAHTSGAPNFAYQRAVDRIKADDLKDLDLSCWRLAYCGAEPVQINTLKAFTEKFSVAQFQSTAFYPCYGLAEASLLVSGGDAVDGFQSVSVDRQSYKNNKIKIASQVDALKFVSVGAPIGVEKILIANPKTMQEVSADGVGEIWVSGDHIAKGYWHNQKATDDTFILDEDKCRFLRTGDLGFIHNDQLYISGRLKDLIIIRGVNHYPEDIEQSVRSLSGAFAATVAVSRNINGKEQLCLLQEIRRSYIKKVEADNLMSEIRAVLIERHGLTLSKLIFVKEGVLARTTSGKLQRQRNKVLMDEYEPLFEDALMV